MFDRLLEKVTVAHRKTHAIREAVDSVDSPVEGAKKPHCKFCGRTLFVKDNRCDVCSAVLGRGAKLTVKYPVKESADPVQRAGGGSFADRVYRDHTVPGWRTKEERDRDIEKNRGLFRRVVAAMKCKQPGMAVKESTEDGGGKVGKESAGDSHHTFTKDQLEKLFSAWGVKESVPTRTGQVVYVGFPPGSNTQFSLAVVKKAKDKSTYGKPMWSVTFTNKSPVNGSGPQVVESTESTEDAPENNEPSKNIYTGSTQPINIEFTDEDLDSLPRQGPADEAVEALVSDPRISKQLDKIFPDDIRAELKGYGAWDKEELSDDEANRRRIVWIAVGDLQEEKGMGNIKKGELQGFQREKPVGKKPVGKKSQGKKPVSEAVRKVPVKCDQCSPSMVNGVFCHEQGCPNQRKRWVPDRGWIKFLKCPECGDSVEDGERCNCLDPIEEPVEESKGRKSR